jgi:hypothetical protein
MSRDERVLGALPACYRAGEPGKLLGAVATALAGPIEEADTHLFRIQRAHRLLVAEQAGDVVRLAAALNLDAFYFEDVLGDRELDEAQRLEVLRERVQRIAGLHLAGLGTPWAVLETAAIFLDTRIVPDRPDGPLVRHVDPEGFVHRVTVEAERRPAAPRAELDLYESPLRRRKVDPAARWPLDGWAVDNQNVAPAPVAFLVRGVGERTVRPGLFSPELAEGVVFDGVVPDGTTLVVDTEGEARLDGHPVGDWLVHFRGGIADMTGLDASTYAVDDGSPSVPFDGDLDTLTEPPFRRRRPVPAAPVGRSSWRFTVAEGRFDASRVDQAVYATEHLPVGVFDGDVGFDGGVFDLPASGIVGMAWNERIPCAFKLVLPPASSLTTDGGEGPSNSVNPVDRVAGVLPRFKPAGVRAYVDTGRDAWVLGRSVLRAPDATEGEGIDRHATVLRDRLADAFVPLDRPAEA